MCFLNEMKYVSVWLLIAKSPFFLLKSVFEQMFLSSEIEIYQKEVANLGVFVLSLHNKQATLRTELQYGNEYLFKTERST